MKTIFSSIFLLNQRAHYRCSVGLDFMKNNTTKVPLFPILELFSTQIDFLLALLIIRTPEFKSLCGILLMQ